MGGMQIVGRRMMMLKVRVRVGISVRVRGTRG
jgi:hypothetical protein